MYFCFVLIYFFFFKQKTAYEMRISDWSSDVCSSDLIPDHGERRAGRDPCGPHPCAAGRGRAHRGGRRRDRRGGRKRGGGERRRRSRPGRCRCAGRAVRRKFLDRLAEGGGAAYGIGDYETGRAHV